MPAPRSSHDIGKGGENLARSYLERHGFHYIERNWRCQAGELDLVMRDNDELVFVEVKSRHGEGAGRAEESLSRTQARRMLNAGEWYVDTHPEVAAMFWRCDLVAVTYRADGDADVAHYVNAIVAG